MLKKYPESAPAEELKIGPDSKLLQMILNYSKSVEVKRTKRKKVLITLN
ncbi:MAG: hypothetical protein RIT43_388 [Bacteroidota bacterium]|jgi:hypothetical protein